MVYMSLCTCSVQWQLLGLHFSEWFRRKPLIRFWKNPVIIPSYSLKASPSLSLGLEESKMILPQPAAALGELESSFYKALLPLLKRNVVAIVGCMVNPYI